MSYQDKKIASVHFPEFKKNLPSMMGKTVVITGTTSGTGKVASTVLAELGAKVIMLNRASSRSEEAFSQLKSAFPEAEIHSIECDLQSFVSVESAASSLKELCPDGVHVLCNNAGVMALKDEATSDGFDVQMQTNHLSHFLLTRELMPLLEQAAAESGEARIVNHSSLARANPKKVLIPKYLEKKGGQLGGNGTSMIFGGARWLRYNQTKLANCAFTAALHNKLQNSGSKVKALVAHPGLAQTSLQKNSIEDGGMNNFFTGLFMKMSQSMEDGALGIINCMCATDVNSGEFHGPGAGSFSMKGLSAPFPLEEYYDNEETRNLLWTKSCEAIGKEFVL
jgi:NAD(P)-dependent dehydrogenase (short-subunit alcohol dehydrogenase family)